MTLPGFRRAIQPVPSAERVQEHIQGGAHAVRVLRAGADVLRAQRSLRARRTLPTRQPRQPHHGHRTAHSRALGIHPVTNIYCCIIIIVVRSTFNV